MLTTHSDDVDHPCRLGSGVIPAMLTTLSGVIFLSFRQY
jgi:hypothetical protein